MHRESAIASLAADAKPTPRLMRVTIAEHYALSTTAVSGGGLAYDVGDMAAEARRVHEIGDGVLTLVDTLPAAPMPKPATHERIVGGEKKAPKTSAAGGGGRRMARNGRAAAMFVPK